MRVDKSDSFDDDLSVPRISPIYAERVQLRLFVFLLIDVFHHTYELRAGEVRRLRRSKSFRASDVVAFGIDS